MGYKIGIMDSDYGYVTSLVLYINSHYNKQLSVAVFTDKRMFQEYLDSYALDAILIEESIKEELAEILVDMPQVIIPLTDENNNNSAGKRTIYKFQSARVIVESILDYLKDNKANANYSFNLVYSPIGRSGKTSFAMELCKQSDNSLYLGMELYWGGAVFDRYSLTEEYNKKFLYYLATRNPLLIEIIKEGPREGNNIFIPLRIRASELEEMDSECFCWLKQLLAESKAFHCTVVDLGVLSEQSILNAFDRVIVTTLPDLASQSKLESFKTLCKASLDKMGRRVVYTNINSRN